MADLIPETIKSQSARDELNKRTSNLPSLGGVAKSFGEPLASPALLNITGPQLLTAHVIV